MNDSKQARVTTKIWAQASLQWGQRGLVSVFVLTLFRWHLILKWIGLLDPVTCQPGTSLCFIYCIWKSQNQRVWNNSLTTHHACTDEPLAPVRFTGRHAWTLFILIIIVLNFSYTNIEMETCHMPSWSCKTRVAYYSENKKIWLDERSETWFDDWDPPKTLMWSSMMRESLYKSKFLPITWPLKLLREMRVAFNFPSLPEDYQTWHSLKSSVQTTCFHGWYGWVTCAATPSVTTGEAGSANETPPVACLSVSSSHRRLVWQTPIVHV